MAVRFFLLAALAAAATAAATTRYSRNLGPPPPKKGCHGGSCGGMAHYPVSTATTFSAVSFCTSLAFFTARL